MYHAVSTVYVILFSRKITQISHIVVDEEVIAELMVESNVTLDTNTILLILNKTTELELSDAKKVTITGRELIAGIVLECFLLSLFFIFISMFICSRLGWYNTHTPLL